MQLSILDHRFSDGLRPRRNLIIILLKFTARNSRIYNFVSEIRLVHFNNDDRDTIQRVHRCFRQSLLIIRPD